MAIDARSRLRGSFADVLQRQAAELGQLARDAVRDPDVRDALLYEIERIQGTAVSLGVDTVTRAAQAAKDAAEGGNLIEAVEHLVDVCRSIEGLEAAFRPVVMLAEETPAGAEEHAAILKLGADVDEVAAMIRAEDPCAVVAPIDQLEKVMATMEGKSRTVPVFAIGPSHDLSRRLMASHLGAAAYLGEPLDLGRVLARIRARTGETDPPPFRVLVVEPDEQSGEMAIKSLSGSGRKVRWLRTAEDLLRVVDELGPELIVLATEVGDHTGLELSEVLRGHELYGDVPVLFLATQDDVERTGFLISADDILVKPITPPVLRGRAIARLERYRYAQRHQQLDRLTGCLSRAAVLRTADREVGLARRSGNPLSVVLLDLDGMHQINAEHGLDVGDRLLRAFAEVLVFNLRETDVIGRVGGDAFGVLMPKCGALDARKRIENVRRKFATWLDQKPYDIDFSAGVADTTGGFRDVLARADRALMEARHAGGARSVIDR